MRERPLITCKKDPGRPFRLFVCYWTAHSAAKPQKLSGPFHTYYGAQVLISSKKKYGVHVQKREQAESLELGL